MPLGYALGPESRVKGRAGHKALQVEEMLSSDCPGWSKVDGPAHT